MPAPAARAAIDPNYKGSLLAVSNVDFKTLVAVAANPTTGAIEIDGTITATNPSVGTTGSSIPASATLIGASDGTNLRQLLTESTSQFNLRTTLYSAGTKLIGQQAMASSLPIVIASDQSAVPISGTVAATQSGNWTSRTVGNAGAIFDGATGTAVPANAVQVGISDGTNLQPITSNSTTFTSKHAADVNILGTLGTAFSTAGKVDVKGADGDVFVRQATASNLKGQMQVQDSSGNGITSTSNALDVNIKSETAPAVSLTRVAIAASSSGDNTLIAAVSAKKIYVVAFELSFSGTVNAKFTDGASGTNLGGLYYGVANAGAAQSVTPDMKLAIPSPYIWAGSTNTALILNLSGATAVGGGITYFTV